MKPFTLYKIIFLLTVFGCNNLYAVQTTATDPAKTESIATLTTTKTIKDSPRKSKRKSKLIEKFKEKFAYLFQKDNTQENSSQNENLETKTHGLAVASLILGIVSIPTLFIIGVGFVLAILAIIFGAIAKGKIKRSGGFYTGKGMATAGLVLGIIPMVFSLLLIAIILSFGGF